MALNIQQLEQLLNTLRPAIEAKKQARLAELTAQVDAEIAQTPEAQQIAILEAEIAELQNPQPVEEPQPEAEQGLDEQPQPQPEGI